MQSLIKSKACRGFTLVEMLLAVGLMALTVTMVSKLIPTFVTPNSRIIDQNNLGSLNTLREIIRIDLANSNAGSVMEDRPDSLYVCRYNANNKCLRPEQSAQQAGNSHGNYCIASSSAGDLQGQNRQVNRFVMYRGVGASFEYFYAQNDMNDFAEIELGNAGSNGNGNRGSDNDYAGTVIHEVLKRLCEAPFDQTPSGLRNASWIRLNNPDVLPLRSFKLCGADNSSFQNLISTSPPNRCLPVLNQTGSPNVQCRPGESGINSLMLYYQFRRNLRVSENNTEQTSEVFSDVVMVNFPAKPCILR